MNELWAVSVHYNDGWNYFVKVGSREEVLEAFKYHYAILHTRHSRRGARPTLRIWRLEDSARVEY